MITGPATILHRCAHDDIGRRSGEHGVRPCEEIMRDSTGIVSKGLKILIHLLSKFMLGSR